MRAVSVAVLATVLLVLGGWSSSLARSGDVHMLMLPSVPKCPKNAPAIGIFRKGFGRVCGPGSAVVWAKGKWHVLKGSGCKTSEGRYDGHIAFGVSSRRGVPHEGLNLIMSSDAAGSVKVEDGELELVPGTREALSGTAYVEPVRTRGTFSVYGRNGTGPDGTTFIGAWSCS